MADASTPANDGEVIDYDHVFAFAMSLRSHDTLPEPLKKLCEAYIALYNARNRVSS